MKRINQILTSIFFITFTTTSFAYDAPSMCEINSKERSLRCATYRQTTNYTCGPASVMALLRYYGKLSSKDMNKQTEMRIATEMNASEKGTTPAHVESWLSNNGFSVSSGLCVTSKLIKNNIDKGIPTLVGYNQHWLLAKGYNKDSSGRDVIYFADSSCGTTSLSSEIVDTMWSMGAMKQSYCGIHSGYYIIARP
jgi:hypothetical protein